MHNTPGHCASKPGEPLNINCVICMHVLGGHESMAKQSILSEFFSRADGKNQREDSEDTETIDKASGSSGSRKQGVASRSFKTSWLKLFPWCNYNPLRDTAYCTDCREVGYSSEWAASKLPPPGS